MLEYGVLATSLQVRHKLRCQSLARNGSKIESSDAESAAPSVPKASRSKPPSTQSIAFGSNCTLVDAVPVGSVTLCGNTQLGSSPNGAPLNEDSDSSNTADAAACLSEGLTNDGLPLKLRTVARIL